MRRGQTAFAAGLWLGVTVWGCGAGGNPADEELFRTACTGCHTLAEPLSKAKTLDGWRKTIWAMRQRGARLTDEEAERLARHLTRVRPAP